MTSRRRGTGHSKWYLTTNVDPRTELVAQDAALLAANSDLALQMSASELGRPPVFEPHRIRFNSRHEPVDDFEYPPDDSPESTAQHGGAKGECWTNHHDYDLLVRTVLLSIKHHLADDAFIMPTGSLGGQRWNEAFDLYRRTFPERKIPSLVGWPPEVEQHLAESEERLRREQECPDHDLIGGPNCPICNAAKARAAGRTTEAPPPVPRPSYLSNDPAQSLLSRILSREDSDQATQ